MTPILYVKTLQMFVSGVSVGYERIMVIKLFPATTYHQPHIIFLLDFFPKLRWRLIYNSLARTNQMGEVHIQSSAVAKVRVHPAAVQDHLRDAFFYNLVILRPEGSQNIKQNNQTSRREI